MFVDDLLKRSTKLYPKKEAVIFEKQRISYQTFLERTYRCAQGLAGLGVKPGERVAVLAGNHSAYVELYFAVPHAGAVLTTVNYRLVSVEIAYILNDAQARVLFVEDRFFSSVEPVLRDTQVEKIIVIGEPKTGFLAYEDFIQKGSPAPLNLPRNEDDVCFQLYTSGTTGKPKGAMTTHKNWIFDCIGCALATGVNKEDRYLIPAPLYHAAAGATAIFGVMCSTTLVIMKDFIPDQVPVLIEEEKTTRALLVPAMLNFVLQSPEVKKRNFSSLKTVVYGASPISEALLQQSFEAFRCEFVQAFGQTESVAVLTCLLPEEHKGHLLKSCGRELHFCEVKIVNENDEELPVGETGEIIARGPMVMKGYFNMPEETEKTLRGGWLHTGDMGMKDKEGYLYVMDRKKDMIISGAENIYPAEVENALAKHPAVLESAVIGIPDEKWGEAVLAVVVKKPGLDVKEEELIEFCRKNLARYKCPARIEYSVSLPRNPSGKVLKTALREPFWKGKDRRVS